MLKTSADQDQKVAELLKKNNPNLCDSPIRLQEELKKIDVQIDLLFTSRPKDWEVAIYIYLQARNGLAVLLNVEVREVDCDLPDGESQEIKVVSVPAIPQEKFVVLHCSSGIISDATYKALEIDSRDISKIKVMNTQLTVEAIADNLVAGVVDLDNFKDYTFDELDRRIRHDLKNCKGWTREMADSVILPPLYIGSSTKIYEGLAIAFEMLNGTYHSSEVIQEKVNLVEYRSSFLARMKTPKTNLNIVIIDDFEPVIQGLVYLLNIWPKVNPTLILSFNDDLPMPQNADIVLLDHDLGFKNYDGKKVAFILQHDPLFDGKVISITSGERQSYGDYHFHKKHRVSSGNLEACHEFIALINQVIQDLEN